MNRGIHRVECALFRSWRGGKGTNLTRRIGKGPTWPVKLQGEMQMKWISALAALVIVVSGVAFWTFGGSSETSNTTSTSASKVLSEDQVALQRELLATAPPEAAPSVGVQSTSAGDIQLAAGPCHPGGLLFTATQWKVVAFFLGYCPTEWALKNTAWGKSIVNYVVNVVGPPIAVQRLCDS